MDIKRGSMKTNKTFNNELRNAINSREWKTAQVRSAANKLHGTLSSPSSTDRYSLLSAFPPALPEGTRARVTRDLIPPQVRTHWDGGSGLFMYNWMGGIEKRSGKARHLTHSHRHRWASDTLAIGRFMSPFYRFRHDGWPATPPIPPPQPSLPWAYISSRLY